MELVSQVTWSRWREAHDDCWGLEMRLTGRLGPGDMLSRVLVAKVSRGRCKRALCSCQKYLKQQRLELPASSS